MSTRLAQAAGRFYPADNTELKEQIKNCFLNKMGPGKLPSQAIKASKTQLLGLIVPHAGYIYSGPVAAWAYLEASKMARPPQNVILIGPNHTGYGQQIGVYPQGSWSTPFGELKVNEELSENIAGLGFSLDKQSHLYEHSIEVQLPFLQFIFGSTFRIVCISMLDQSLDAALKLAENLAEILKNESFLIVATTDLTHYETEESARLKDKKLLKVFKEGNTSEVYKTAAEINASACGLGPATAVLRAAALLGGKQIDLLKYETSAAITNDTESVVGSFKQS